jgi:hypothetical protein
MKATTLVCTLSGFTRMKPTKKLLKRATAQQAGELVIGGGNVPEKSEWQQIAEDLHQAYECQQVMLGLINTHTECGQCEAAVDRFNKGNTMDREEWQKAIENANTYQKKPYSGWPDKQHQEFIVQDAEYWRKRYLDETIETMRLRKQCWELRDKYADLRESILNLLKKGEK